MKCAAFLFLFTLCQHLLAQDEAWHHGSLVLHTGEVVTGLLHVQARHDVLLFRAEGAAGCVVYPAHKVRYAQYYDAGANVHHKFIMLESKSRPTLFEIVVNGPVYIVRHQKMIVHTVRSQADDFNYFVYFRQQMRPLRDFDERVFPALLVGGGALFASWVHNNQLDAASPADAIRIAEGYNKLATEESSLARQ